MLLLEPGLFAITLPARPAEGEDKVPGTGQYTEELELGPAEVWFGTAGSERDIGALVGGATLTIEPLLADLKKDSFGDGIYDQVIVGANAMLEANLGDLRYDGLVDVIPGATLTDDGDPTPTQSKLQIALVPGTSLRDNAKQLILKRIVDGSASTDEDDWWTFPVAAVVSTVELTFDATTQRRLPVTFRILPNASTKVLGYKGYSTPT